MLIKLKSVIIEFCKYFGLSLKKEKREGIKKHSLQCAGRDWYLLLLDYLLTIGLNQVCVWWGDINK